MYYDGKLCSKGFFVKRLIFILNVYILFQSNDLVKLSFGNLLGLLHLSLKMRINCSFPWPNYHLLVRGISIVYTCILNNNNDNVVSEGLACIIAVNCQKNKIK